MDKIFDHKTYENKIFDKWTKKGYFSKHDVNKKPFTILLPPPNVTGILHVGHALDAFLPDTINRYYKLHDYDVWFIAGMDHAGIATQSKVEQLLVSQGTSKHEVGRTEFLNQCYKWKDQYSQNIRNQWKTLGLSLDLKRERFTLDKEANEAVLKAFVLLYQRGFIYRDNLAINWDPKLKTALSNIEVINKETPQDMIYIKYPVANSTEFIEIATVRTETLYSDVAVMFNPKDSRYKHLIGKTIIHPLLKKELPILTDEYIDPKFGTGLMKLSAHAATDIDIIKKFNLEINETIDESGILYNANEFSGMERFQARQEITKHLQETGFVSKIVHTTSNVGYSERSNEVVEVLVRPQWFVKMKEFGQAILDNLKSKNAPKVYPNRFVKILKQWMEGVHDWTISRQLWWGHRIPVWYKNEEIKVQIESPGEGWIQDPDVLDTWFSSGLSSFAFLGWPQTDEHLKHYYPVSLLVTGRDLIFFWIARMYFFSIEFMGQAPFKDILLHGLVRDENNVKMSKSLNNGIDPIKVIDQYGSDSLRWSLISNSSAGNDIRLGNSNFVTAQSVITKLWNVARYIKNKEDDNNLVLFGVDKWIENKLGILNSTIDKLIKKYEFPAIGKAVENFIYNEFSSWFIELSKYLPNKKASMNILRKALLILHPFFPFVTDQIFSETFNESLLDNLIKKPKKYSINNDIDTIIEIVSSVRTYRHENEIPMSNVIQAKFSNDLSQEVLNGIKKLANIEISNQGSYLIALNSGNLYLKITEEQQAKKREFILEKIKFYEAEVERSERILSNKAFVQKAPKNKLKIEQDKYEDYKIKLENYRKELEWN